MDFHIKLSNAMYAASLELSGLAKTKAIEESILQIMKAMTGAEKDPRAKEIFQERILLCSKSFVERIEKSMITPPCNDPNKDEKSLKSTISDVLKNAVDDAKVTKTNEIFWENLILPKGTYIGKVRKIFA